jgi:hypothetical protein
MDGGVGYEGSKMIAGISGLTPLKMKPRGKESEDEEETFTVPPTPRKSSPPPTSIFTISKTNEFFIKYDDLKPAFKLYFERESSKEIEAEDDDWD